MRVNLSDVGTGFDPVPAGRYLVRADKGELRQAKTDGEAKHPGSWFIAWDFVVNQGEFEGRHVFDNTSFAHEIDGVGCPNDDEETFNKALFKLKGLLDASDLWSKEQLNDPEFEFDIEDVVGTEFVVAVTLEKSEQYGDSNRIKRYMPASQFTAAGSSLLP